MKILVALLAIVALLMPIGISQSQTAQIQVTLLNQDPDPVEPGNVVDVRFKLENTGSTALQNVVFEVLPKYPFTLVENSTKEIGTLQSNQINQEGVIVRYRLRVDSNAPSGDYTIDIRYKRGEAWVIVEDLVLNVKTKEADLIIKSVTTDPDLAVPGLTTNVTVLLENQLPERVKEVKVKLDLTSDLPFAPFGSASEISIPDFAGSSEQAVVFKIITKPNAVADVYKIPISVTFKDQDDNKFNKTTITGVRVGSEPEILALVDKSNIVGKTSGVVTIKLVNNGLSDLRFVVVSLEPTNQIDVLSSNSLYLGEIESDDFETADFNIKVKEDENGRVNLPVKISFRDASNQQFQMDKPVSLRLLTNDEAKQLGLTSGGEFPWLIVVIIVAGIALWWFKLRKKKR